MNEQKDNIQKPKFVFKVKQGTFVLMEGIQPFDNYIDAKKKKYELMDVNSELKIKVVEQLSKFYLYLLKK
jgi:hypothetical protein